MAVARRRMDGAERGCWYTLVYRICLGVNKLLNDITVFTCLVKVRKLEWLKLRPAAARPKNCVKLNR